MTGPADHLQSTSGGLASGGGPKFCGGCQCGAVRYRIDGAFGEAHICHCRMCQKAFGAGFAPLVSVQTADLTWTRGEPTEFQSSPIVARGFCRECGTPLYMREAGDPITEIAVGSLDDPEAVGAFAGQVGVESKRSWFDTLHTLPQKTTQADRTPEDLVKLVSLQHPDHDTDTWPPS